MEIECCVRTVHIRTVHTASAMCLCSVQCNAMQCALNTFETKIARVVHSVESLYSKSRQDLSK